VRQKRDAAGLHWGAAGLYDKDFFEWTQRNAELLWAGKLDEVDVEHVAEEIEDMGKRDQRAALNHAVVLVLHLLKWKLQPERRCDSWTESIVRERLYLESLFEQSTRLRNHVCEKWDTVLKRAAAAAEMQRLIPGSEIPDWTLVEVLDEGFRPE
jgi:hypothetical protein